jgi:hypothetical protein
MKQLLLFVFTAVSLASSPFAFRACAEEVTVTYTDGKFDKGDLIEQSPEKITLRVMMGGNKLDLPIPWMRIKTVSNGLTQETATKKWKDDNKDKLCPECTGDRKNACKQCNGLGLLARALIACTACKGKGAGACTAKGCDKGEVACPGNCLKFSEGKWVKGKEDLMWRRFDYKGGYMEWSERHLGEVIAMEDGKPVNKGKCPLCNGTTKAACKVCEGQGAAKCALCKGLMQIPEPGPDHKCPDCKGLKSITCPTCKGTGLKQ